MSEGADDSRTLPPTQRRIEQFRKRGEIALSRDLVAFASLMGGALITQRYLGDTGRSIIGFLRISFGALDHAVAGEALRNAGATFVAAAFPGAVGALACAVIGMALQLGWPPAFLTPKFDPSRVASPGAIGQLLSPKAAAGRVGKALAKFLVVGAACYFAVREEERRFIELPALEPMQLGMHLAEAAGRLFFRAGLPLGVLAGLDFLLAKRRIDARMRMKPDEMKREHREQEGDPMIKRKRRRRMRELAKRRLQSAVKTADVVIVNPTEYAVALRYQPGKDRAPRVVAKGRGAVAERIREFARSAGIPIVAEPPLCRLIHKLVPEGREIPTQLYHAVAEVLAYVYRLRRRS